LAWIGSNYADKGWVQLTDAEQEALRKAEVVARVDAEKNLATEKLNNLAITVGEKIFWNDYLLALDAVCLCPDFDCDPKFPPKPVL
jgi:co-chaperonin GroES (HSP10)